MFQRKFPKFSMTVLITIMGIGCSGSERFEFPTGSLEGRSMMDVGWSDFGGIYAGRGYLDTKCSRSILPTTMLDSEGSLKAHWMKATELGELIIEKYDSDNPRHKGVPGSPDSWNLYVITIRNGGKDVSSWVTNISYDSFLLYPMDVDRDGIDELVMETGRGRGTSVYVRSVEIISLRTGRPERLFEMTLNGYVWVRSPEPWERRYAFIDLGKNKPLGLYFYLLPPPGVPRNLSRQDKLDDFQLPRRFYEFNAKLETYELTHFEFKRLEDVIKDYRAANSPEAASQPAPTRP